MAGTVCVSTTTITNLQREGIVCQDAEWVKVDDTLIAGCGSKHLETCGVKMTGRLANASSRPNHQIQHTSIAKCATGMACQKANVMARKLNINECRVGVRVSAAVCHLFQADIRSCIDTGVHVCSFTCATDAPTPGYRSA